MTSHWLSVEVSTSVHYLEAIWWLCSASSFLGVPHHGRQQHHHRHYGNRGVPPPWWQAPDTRRRAAHWPTRGRAWRLHMIDRRAGQSGRLEEEHGRSLMDLMKCSLWHWTGFSVKRKSIGIITIWLESWTSAHTKCKQEKIWTSKNFS